ncbi:MAG: MBL fold metallo-hydrolase [Clostridium sp.]|jgi:competence protein ComEC|nr:MBL fold metallo-hydrolase [Clostridium sp.]
MKRLLMVLLVIMLLTSFIGCSTVNSPVRTSNSNDYITQEPSEMPGAISQDKKTLSPLEVHFLDVGQADCILIKTPLQKVILIDSGKNSHENTVVSYIKSQGIDTIDAVVGTHPHEDHIGGLDAVINNFDIGKIFMPKVSHTTKTFEDVLNAVKNKGLKVTTAFAGTNIEVDTNLKVEMLSPNSETYDDMNNYSAVIKLSYNNTSFLFTGDAESISEQEMISKGYDLKADVLKVGHHGSATSTTALFLNKVSPQYAIISVGKENSYGHPDNLILNRLKTFGVEVFRTDEAGTIIATSDGETIKFDKISK